MSLIRLVSMREIQFRAKCVDIDEQSTPSDGWVEGYYRLDVSGGKLCHYIFSCPMEWEIDPNSLGQFTGLFDRNGRAIYEGDIIHTEDLPWFTDYVVKWDVIGARFIFVSTKPCGYLTPRDFNFEYVEVIGNTIDNPELLTNKN